MLIRMVLCMVPNGGYDSDVQFEKVEISAIGEVVPILPCRTPVSNVLVVEPVLIGDLLVGLLHANYTVTVMMNPCCYNWDDYRLREGI